MTQTINISNGDVLNFPDEMSDEDIQSVIQKEYGSYGNSSQKSIINSDNQQSSTDKLKQFMNQGRTSTDTARDLLYGVLVGLGKGGQTIGDLPYELSTGKTAPNKINFEQMFSGIESPKKSTSGEIEKSIGKYLPYGIAGGTSSLGQILSGGAYGGLTSDKNQQNIFGFPSGKKGAAMEGLLLNALGVGALKGSQKVMEFIPKSINSLRPNKASSEVKSILTNNYPNKLESNPINLRENSESLANDIKNSYKKHVDVVGEKMNPVMQKYGESLYVYPLENPSGIHAYRNIPDFEFNDKKLNDSYDLFASNPNLNNAHQLQQKIGEEIGSIEKLPKDSSNREQLKNLKSAYGELNSKIDQRLQEVDPDSASQWKEGREYHRLNVIPYRSNKKIRDIIEGNVSSPKNIHKPFENPGTKFDKKTRQNILDNSNKIISDLPQESKNKILLSKIGGLSANDTPNKLLSNLSKAKDKGYDTYFTKDLDEKMNVLRKSIKNQERFNPLNWLNYITGKMRK